MTPTIRPMTPEDFPLLAAWMVETPLWQRYGLTFAQAVANFRAAQERGDWLITADAERRACGFAWAVPTGAFARSPYLRLIGVYPGMTGTGIGGLLLSAIEEQAAQVAADLFLLVSDFNEAGQRFYQAHGYEQIGAIRGYVVPTVTELIYRKRLK